MTGRCHISSVILIAIAAGCGGGDRPRPVRPTRPDVSDAVSPVVDSSTDSRSQAVVVAETPPNHVDLIEANWSELQSLVAGQHGKIVVVDVWSTSCTPCVHEFPQLIELSQRFANDVVAVSFNIDYAGIKNKPTAFYRERVLKFLGSQVENAVLHRMSTTAAEDLFTGIKLDSIPAVYVYGRDGNLLKRFDGSDGNGEEVSYEKQIVPFVGNLVNGLVAVPVPAAKPVGGEQEIQTYPAIDTLNPGEAASDDAKQCLEGLVWTPARFDVTVKPNVHPLDPSIVRFPSPRPTGVATNDLVALEWYSAKNERDEVIDAPAIVVVHESGSRMEVGRLIARALHAQGLHAFMIQLPTYGLRRTENAEPRPELIDAVMRQGIADARRARDAVAVLPHVDARSISIQGTSLGGFVTATTAGLDRGFSTVHIMVSGGNLFELVANGQREAGRLRDDLAKAGFTGEKLKQLLAPIEPLRLAHRMDPGNTWLYTANRDQVVPPQHATELREAARIDKDHEMILIADHYSGIIYVPVIVADIARKIRDELSSRRQ